jgi:hypothetical protein
MNRNVTFIDDLFDANEMLGNDKDFTQKDNQARDAYTDQIMNRHIRKNNDPSFGINGGQAIVPMGMGQGMGQGMSMPMGMGQQGMMQQQNMGYNMGQPEIIPFEYELPRYHPHPHHQSELSCMTIANHIKECPICSKFYNCDNSIYIVCIVLLIVICIILLKRIIEK